MNYDEAVYRRLINYRKFENILTKSKDRKCEIETHHIVPKSIGGTNDPSNLVNLTVEEHILAHKLLYYIYKFKPDCKTEFIKLTCAWHRMITRYQGKYIDPRTRVKDITIVKLAIGKQLNQRLNDFIIITNGTIEKVFNKNEPMPEGWTFVRFLNPGTKGKVWINNGKEQTLVFETDIPDGWQRGQLKSKKKQNKRIITNGTITVSINKDEPIPPGWRIGFATGGQLKGCKFVNDGVKTICVKKGETVQKEYISGYAKKPERHYYINDGTNIRAIPESQQIPDGWMPGRIKGQYKWITDGKRCMRLYNGDPMPEGWKIRTNEFPSTKGKIAITNNVITKFISPDEAIPAGWHIGSAKQTIRGRTYYNNGKVQCIIKPGDQIPTGYVKGKLSFIFINNGKIMKKLVKGMPMPDGFVVGKIKKTAVKQQE